MPIHCISNTPARASWRIAVLSATTLAIGLLAALPEAARAQFTGNQGTDLVSGNSTDVTRINATPDAIPNAGGASSGPAQLKSQASPRQRAGDQPESRGLPYERPVYRPSEFELYVQRIVASSQRVAPTLAQADNAPLVQRFGANLATDDALASQTQDPLPSVPGDYVIRAGDEIQVSIWGSVDANLNLTVDRSGRIALPRVGAVSVAGVTNASLADTLSHRVGETFRNFQLTATVGQVRPIRVFVGGYVVHPGSITVNGLSSVLHAIMRAGGPAAAGSFRDIHLRRGNRDVAVFDLYDLLLKGDHNTDQLVQPDDLIFVGPIGTQVAILGSVNQQAIYELKPLETLDDALRMAGGFDAVADRSRVSIERLADRVSGRVAEWTLPAHQSDHLSTGDVIRAFSVVSAALPQGAQRQHVRIEGEVQRPGDYIMPPGSRISDALRVAGGMTTTAYPYGTEFTRESVRRSQEINYERALRDLETEMSRNQAGQRVTSSEELATQNATAGANARLLDRLRQVRPTGRIVLQLPPESTTLPDLALEDGDTIDIPARNSSVGIFGSVFNSGSYVFEPSHNVLQYLALAGGPTRSADKDSVFMIRANGSVISARQGASFWHSGNDLNEATVQPGDTIFVPEQINKSTFVQDAKDWTQILYQFGLGLAGIKSLGL